MSSQPHDARDNDEAETLEERELDKESQATDEGMPQSPSEASDDTAE